MKFATRAVHEGNEFDPQTGAVMSPIYMTSTFALEFPGHSRGFEYTRANNPNFVKLEHVLASLEQTSEAPVYATVFSSGIGAFNALLSTLKSGDRIVAVDGIYGGTYRILTQVFNKFGIEFITVIPRTNTLEEVEQALKEKSTQWLIFESPTNPLLNIFDIEALCALARKYDALSVVDNTFASPYCQNPFGLGADIVWHSTTKYLSGHSDVLGGVVMTQSAEMKQQLDFARKTLGANPSPFDCWLIMRGVKTLPVRMEQHQKNALQIARYLEQHPKVRRVYYPGLYSHPGHELALKQMRAFNGMLSAEFDLSLESIKQLISSFRYFTLAESLGGIESLVSHPASMTHAIVPKKEREELGITDSLVRFSIGIEDVTDLIHDLEDRLQGAT